MKHLGWISKSWKIIFFVSTNQKFPRHFKAANDVCWTSNLDILFKNKIGSALFLIGVIRCNLTLLRFFKVYIWFWHMFTMYKMAITIFRCFSCSTYFNFFFFLTKIAEYLKFDIMGWFCNLTLKIHIRGSYSIYRYLSLRTRFGIYFSIKKIVNYWSVTWK